MWLIICEGGCVLIVTKRKTPEQLAYYEVLLRRGEKVDEGVRQKFFHLRAGLIGERRVDREWKELKITHELYHDFTCVNEFGHTHQIDTLFVCKHFILVVEVKNVSGRIDFDDQRRQFIRTKEDGSLESFMNPVDQVKRHREILENEALSWPEHVPIEAVIVIANTSTIIGRVSSEVPIFNVSGLRSKVYELVKKYEHISFNIRTVRSYLEALYHPLKRQVNLLDVPIRKGVLCERCNDVMIHSGSVRSFICTKCGWRDRDMIALRNAMYDYRVLYSEGISNKAFRDFVGIENVSTANKTLKRLFEKSKGKTKGKVYIIPPNIKVNRK